jgi:hypothetical protein
MAQKALPCPTVLRQLMEYDPLTGALVWKRQATPAFMPLAEPKKITLARWNGKAAGRPALNSNSKTGRKRGSIFGRSVFAHRAAWAIYYGEWPQDEIDHINGDHADNRIVNLRPATRAENAQNRGPVKGSASRFKGVYRVQGKDQWFGQINLKGRSTHLGTFGSEEEAARAYNAAATQHHGPFARLNAVP